MLEVGGESRASTSSSISVGLSGIGSMPSCFRLVLRRRIGQHLRARRVQSSRRCRAASSPASNTPNQIALSASCNPTRPASARRADRRRAFGGRYQRARTWPSRISGSARGERTEIEVDPSAHAYPAITSEPPRYGTCVRLDPGGEAEFLGSWICTALADADRAERRSSRAVPWRRR